MGWLLIPLRGRSLQGLLNTLFPLNLPTTHDLIPQLGPTTSVTPSSHFCETTGFLLKKQLFSAASKVSLQLLRETPQHQQSSWTVSVPPRHSPQLLLLRQPATLSHTEHALQQTPTLSGTLQAESLIRKSIFLCLSEVFLVQPF